MRLVKSLAKTILPRRLQSTLRRMAHERKIRGTPFPFVVTLPPQSDNALNCCVAYNKYGAYCVPISGLRRPAALHVLAGDVWEAPTLDFMAAHCRDGDIIHAGTFFGDFLPPLSCSVSNSAKIWAFEPHPESYRCASITIQLNQLRNIEIMNAGLGEHRGSQLLVTTDFSGVPLGGASQIAPNSKDEWNARGHSTVPIQIATIDDVVPEARSVSIIQLDVEGYEQRALTGALRTIRQHRPILIIETLPDDKWMLENLIPLGYRVTERILENVILRCD
jgi:FkbM family methyltransferase